MPYICLARTDIPDGTLQVLDLVPNTSLRSNLDPPGQTRYVNRVQNDPVIVTASGALLRQNDPNASLRGLSAYLADRVDPGGSEAAVGTVQMVGPLVGDLVTLGGVAFTAVENTAEGTVTVNDPTAAVGRLTLGLVAFDCVEGAATGTIQVAGIQNGDTITIAGVLFTATNGANDFPNQVFQDSATAGSDIASAGFLAQAINDAATQALLTAALDALVPAATGGTLTGASGGTDTVTLTPSVLGAWGDATLAESTGGLRVVLSGAAMTHTDPNPAAQEFGSAAHYEGQTDPSVQVAASIAATVNDVATQALIGAAYAGPAPGALDGSMTAVAATDTVTLTATLPGFSGQLDMATTEAAELVLSAATLTLAAPVAASQEWGSLIQMGTNVLAAGSLATTLNNAASDVLLAAVGSTVTAANGGTDTVTITADTTGSPGSMTLTSTDAAREILSDDHLARTMETWTTALLSAAAAALIARVDAGAALAAANMNAAMNAIVGVSGISVAGAGTSSVLDILEILAGRGYVVPAGTSKNPSGFDWDTTAAGAFTSANTVFDSVMIGGVITASIPWKRHPGLGITRGGDTENVENKPIRATVDGSSFQQSLLDGHLSALQDGSVTLFPDSDLLPFQATWYQPGPVTAEVTPTRIVTVYNNDGTLA